MAVPRPASLARRALPALAIAGLSGGLLVKLDNPAPASASGGLDDVSPTTRAGRATTTATPDDTVAAPTTPSTARARTTSTTAATARPTLPGGRTTPTTSAVRPSASTAAPATRATAAPTVPATAAPAEPAEPADSAACDAEPVAGPTVSTRWGPVQVAAVFAADGSLCDVQVLQYPTDHRKSVSINQRALPVLEREAVAAGSADIDVVTGATITSDAYATSLQAILDGRG